MLKPGEKLEDVIKEQPIVPQQIEKPVKPKVPNTRELFPVTTQASVKKPELEIDYYLYSSKK